MNIQKYTELYLSDKEHLQRLLIRKQLQERENVFKWFCFSLYIKVQIDTNRHFTVCIVQGLLNGSSVHISKYSTESVHVYTFIIKEIIEWIYKMQTDPSERLHDVTMSPWHRTIQIAYFKYRNMIFIVGHKETLRCLERTVWSIIPYRQILGKFKTRDRHIARIILKKRKSIAGIDIFLNCGFYPEIAHLKGFRYWNVTYCCKISELKTIAHIIWWSILYGTFW